MSEIKSQKYWIDRYVLLREVHGMYEAIPMLVAEINKQAVKITLKEAAHIIYKDIYEPAGFTYTGKRAEQSILSLEESILKKLGG